MFKRIQMVLNYYRTEERTMICCLVQNTKDRKEYFINCFDVEDKQLEKKKKTKLTQGTLTRYFVKEKNHMKKK